MTLALMQESLTHTTPMLQICVAAEEKSQTARRAAALLSAGGALGTIGDAREPNSVVVLGRAAAEAMLGGNMGQTATGIVRRLGRPVLLVGEGATMGQGPAVAAVSLSENSIMVAECAAHLAGAMGLPMDVVHVIDSGHDRSRPDNLMSVMCACETLGRRACGARQTSRARLRYGPIAEMLTGRDAVKNAAFLAVGVALDAGGAQAQGDALVEAVANGAPCPVLLVPEP